LATCRIQTEPVCRRADGALTVSPISRAAFSSREETRRRLGLAPDEPALLVTMGGIPERHGFLDRLAASPGVTFLLPGCRDAGDAVSRHANVLRFAPRCGFHHPDLVRAADTVVGKLGYSTVAEVYAAGTPFVFVGRPKFRESVALAQFARAEMGAEEIGLADFRDGGWVGRAQEWTDRPRRPGAAAGEGAREAASILRKWIA
jgi:hypothetical protein